MRLPFRISVLPFLISLLILASCSKNNKQGLLIPKDAAFVIHLNGESLNKKLPWDEIKQNPMFMEHMSDSSMPAFVKAVLENPDNSGIDITKDMIIFMEKDSTGGYIAISGVVKDAEKFKTFNMTASENGTASEADGISYISKAPVNVGWKKDKFLYIIDAPQLNAMNGDIRSYMDTTPVIRPTRDLMATTRSVFAMKASATLGEESKFTDLMKTDGDVHLWLNAESLYKGNLGMAALSMVKLDVLFEGNITAATINFDNGKITMDSRSYGSKEMTKLMKKYAGSGLNKDMIKRIPSKDVAGVFALNFKPEGIKELVKLMGMEGFANLGMAFLGLSLDDLVAAMGGDVMIAATNLRPSLSDSTKAKTEIDVLFSSSIGDKDAFQKLINAGDKMGKDKFGDSMPSDISYKADAKLFAIGNSKENVDKYMAGGNNSFDWLDEISGNPFGGYVNLQYIMKALAPEIGQDSTEKIVYAESLKMWDNAYLKGGNFKGGGMEQHIEINLVDKTTNSLKQLNRYLGAIGPVMHKAHKDEIKMRNTTSDTTVVVAPVQPN